MMWLIMITCSFFQGGVEWRINITGPGGNTVVVFGRIELYR